MKRKKYIVKLNASEYEIDVIREPNKKYKISGLGNSVEVRLLETSGDKILLEVDGEKCRVTWSSKGDLILLDGEPLTIEYLREIVSIKGRFREEQKLIEGTVTAPMPGKVVKIIVSKGNNVTKGSPLIVIESMKMENIVAAPREGIVKEIYVSVGETVNKGSRLLLIE